MRALLGGADRGPILAAGFVFGALALLATSVLTGSAEAEVAPLIALGVILAIAYKTLLAWPALLAGLVIVILFIPIKRYTLPGHLPFELEPYRLLVGVIVLLWITALLVAPRVKLRKHGFEAPMLLIVLGVVGSILANGSRITELSLDSEVMKALTFFLSFWLVVYLMVSVVRTFETAEFLVKVMVAGGAVVAFFSLFEARTGFNLFDHVETFVPILDQTEIADSLTRGGALRANGSAQGAIPLGAALVLLIPIAAYLGNRVNPRWWVAVGLLALGALSTRSRTGVVMMIVLILAFMWMRPKQTKRFIVPALLPAVVIVHLALPGAIGGLKSSFFPEGGLLAQQSQNAGSRGSGRIADLGPALDEWSQKPMLGQGYGTRLTGREHRFDGRGAHILDNQWLKSLLEIGVAGVVGWLWLFIGVVRRTGKRAKNDHSDYGWLLAAISGSVLAFGVGMYFYDAFSFIQVTFLFYILMALGAALLAMPPKHRSPARSAT
jgi:polysaccharide biosynthesis protein PslJ